MANGADKTERDADNYWGVDDFDPAYMEWCAENDEEPDAEQEAEFVRERAEDRDYDAYRERDF